MGKKDREKKDKKDKFIKIRSIEERREVIKPILEKLTELQLTTVFEPIKELMQKLKLFINEGGIYHINILFEEINRKIKGYLTDNSSENVWVKLEILK